MVIVYCVPVFMYCVPVFPDTAPPGSPADRVAALDLFLGETEVERVGLGIRMLRRFSDLALREAERLDRAAAARAARLDTAEALLAAASEAERLTDTDTDTDTDEDAEESEDVDVDLQADAVESLQPSGETSLALHRLTRMVRLNIMLEQKLIADFRAPKTEAAPKPPAEPSRWAKFGAGAELTRAKAGARELAEDSAVADERLDSEHLEALLAEFDAEMAGGKHDKELLKEWGNNVAEKFLKARGIKPDYRAMCARTVAAMEAASNGRHANGTPILRPAEYDELEPGKSPAGRPQPGDPDREAEPPEGPSGTGPPQPP